MKKFKKSFFIFSLLLFGGVLVTLGNGCSKVETAPDVAPTPTVPLSESCNTTTGYFKALETCTAEKPCINLSKEFTDQGITQLTAPIIKPTCKNTSGTIDDGEPYSATGIEGTTRYACIHRPTAANNRPLIIWFHAGGSGLASDLYNETLLRTKSDSYNLGGASNGFVIASIQARTLRYPTDWPRDGYHHDFYFRSLVSPTTNPDIAFTDHLIDTLVSQGGIDRSRIYVMGWSNGAMFSQMYAVARHLTPTPSGNKVAAAAVFSGGDPFHNINFSESPSCRLDPYPTSNVPIFIIRRDCDAALACNQTQQTWFETPPGHETESWLTEGVTKVGAQISSLTINGFAQNSTGCVTDRLQCKNAYGMSSYCSSNGLSDAQCAEYAALVNHLRWPSGIREGGGTADREPVLLEFLKSNPHPNP